MSSTRTSPNGRHSRGSKAPRTGAGDFTELLALARSERDARLEPLWRLNPAERVAAMRGGRLTMEQCCAWAARYPSQVPLLNGEFEFIAAFTSEACLRMTADHPGDVRGFYAALGIDLPDRALRNAASRCFAAPESHANADRSPSCSINLASGVWKCHGCGAHGGPYDAALVAGRTPRSAMTLLIEHGLAEPREPDAIRRTARADTHLERHTARPRRSLELAGAASSRRARR